MPKVTCYDPEGVAHSVESVDAREYIKSGHYTMAPAAVPVPETVVEPAVGPEVVVPAAVPAPDGASKPGRKPKA